VTQRDPSATASKTRYCRREVQATGGRRR